MQNILLCSNKQSFIIVKYLHLIIIIIIIIIIVIKVKPGKKKKIVQCIINIVKETENKLFDTILHPTPLSGDIGENSFINSTVKVLQSDIVLKTI